MTPVAASFSARQVVVNKVLMSLAVIGLLQSAAANAAPYGTDPDWPCQSRLVQTLSPGTMWSGPSLDGLPDWHKEPAVQALVIQISPRSFKVEDGEAAIDDFAKEAGANKAKLLPLVFAGLFDTIGQDRTTIIQRIKDFAKRQRNISAHIAEMSAAIDKLPADTPDAKREELNQQRLFATREFDNAERTVRYACEIPTELEARLGSYARAIQDKLN